MKMRPTSVRQCDTAWQSKLLSAIVAVHDLPLGVELSDQLPTIFLSGQATTHLLKLLLGERHLSTATLARDLNEAWLGAGSYRAAREASTFVSKGPSGRSSP